MLTATVAVAAPDKVATYKSALVGSDATAAASAADELGKIKGAPAHDALLDGLAWGLPAGVAEKALAAVGPTLDAGDLSIVQPYLGHHNVAIRAAAYKAVGTSRDAAVSSLLARGLGDPSPVVREAAGDGVVKLKMKSAIPALMTLLDKGDEPGIKALAALADVDLARQIGDHLGTAPDAALADCLGRILVRPDFGPDTARVDIIHAIGKIPGTDAVTALTNYVDSVPKTPPRPSRKEAETVVEQRLGGDQ